MSARAASACCPACGRRLDTPGSQPGGWRLEFETGSLFIDGRRIALTPAQAVILDALLRANGTCVPTRDLIRALYGGSGAIEPMAPEKTLHALMCHLRRRLAGTRLAIETRRGYGFLAVVHPPQTR